MSGQDWLGRVAHDLVKRVVWPARDRRDLGGAVVPGELRATLVDEEGGPIGAQELWQRLSAEAPGSASPAALAAFGAALTAAVRAAQTNDVEGVLALQEAYATLARIVKSGGES
jgi:hypothetical protein